MSRDYGTYPRFGLRRRTRPRRQPGCGLFILALLFFLMIGFFWITRSSSGMHAFVARDPGYALYTTDLLATAQRVAGSRVWDVIPDDRPEYDWRYRLAGGLPLPEWMIRNLFHGLCHVSGNDLKEFSDPVIVTGITRVGNLLERMHIFVGAIDSDHAGGLNLRHIPDAGIYYAVRGRVLLISPSRAALIHSLTLHESASADEETLETMEAALNSTDAVLQARTAGLQAPETLAPQLALFESFSVSARFERDTLLCAVDARLSTEAQNNLRPVVGELKPMSVPQPHDAIVSVAWNLGAPVSEIWSRYNNTLDEPLDLSALLGAGEENNSEDVVEPGVSDLLARIAQMLGGSGRIMLRSVDQNEMLPAPELVGLFEADANAVKTMITALPPWLEGDGALTYSPFYDAETRTVRMPVVGGPSMELTAAVYGNEALLGTSRPASLALMQEEPINAIVGQPGNLYLNAHPATMMREIAAAGAQFAESGLLRDYTVESFNADAAYWQEIADQITSVVALLGYENGAVSLDMQMNVASGD